MSFFKKSKSKIFCIGTGKTGTTSVEKALRDLGYTLGDQPTAELLLPAYVARNFKPIIDYCHSAEAFQDAPFCFKYTFISLDQAFPNSKFILTIRDSEDQWYDSLIKFHSKLYANDERLPTVEDLKNATYRYKGYTWDVRKQVFGFSETDNPYDRDVFIEYYRSHNQTILDYFKYRDNLLVLNVSDSGAYQKLCDFLERKPKYDAFPWENKTSAIKITKDAK